MGSSFVINNVNAEERCIFSFEDDYGQRNIMPVSKKLRKYFLVDHEIVSFTCPQIISINYDDQLRGYYGWFCFVFYSFLRAEGKVVNYKGKNKFPYSFLVCCCYQSVFVSVSACCGAKTTGLGQKIEMIMRTEEMKRLQDFDQTERTASEKRKQFSETTKCWDTILQKTGMKNRFSLTRDFTSLKHFL